MTDSRFQMVVKYGGVALLISGVLNIWVVMRNVEVYRDAARVDAQFQQLASQHQAMQGVVQEFAQRAATDAGVAEVLARAQSIGHGPQIAAPPTPAKTGEMIAP